MTDTTFTGDLAGIAEEDLVALHTYLHQLNAPIDAALRGDDPQAWQPHEPHVRLATHALLQLPAVRGPVYRAATLDIAELEALEPGMVLVEPSFLCCSADPARRFDGNVLFAIFAQQARSVSALSATPAENEVVFFAQTRFKVLAVDADRATGQATVYLAELPDPRLRPQRPVSH